MKFFHEAEPGIFIATGCLQTEQDGCDWTVEYSELLAANRPLAVIVNVILILSVMSMIGATLTLPGIAGIVLTVGTAVDANVIIYERIREELRAGKRVAAAINNGFNEAMSAIIDANVTTFIAALVMFFLGSGPVKGFAVTLTIGLVTSVFTAIFLTRLMIVWWLEWRKPVQLNL